MTRAKNSLANLDRDKSGDAGGSLPKSYPMVQADTGAILLVVSATARDALIEDGAAREATAQDLGVAGRLDLLPHL